VHEGPASCEYGCTGFGECVKACAYGALYIADGIAHVIESKCTACGMCAKTCPKKIIDILPADTMYSVRCSNKDRGAMIRKNCAVGCIGCFRCEKACLEGAAKVKENLARVDPYLCKKCGECMRGCPQKSIAEYNCVVGKSA
jgi:heterodisulfide reductase subunit A-like polyferredoxin